MKLGLAFGTSNTCVSYMDNNIPLVMKFSHAGISKDVLPSASFYPTEKSDGVHGLQALEYAFTRQGTLIRSLKRDLKNLLV